MASSSSSSHQAPARRYDVFISFRGEDTRHTFASHLRAALSRNGISTFNNVELRAEAGDIASSILRGIEGSTISIIIFTENYAESKWCLKELGKILECMRYNGQTVIPVFYGVDPSHVRNQTGGFGAAHARLEERLREEETMREIRSNLTEAANISGWDLQSLRSESNLIKSIVGDILNRLSKFNHSATLLGIASHVERIETLLSLDSLDLRVDDGNRRSPQIPLEVVLKYVFLTINLVLGIVMVILDQIGSAQKPVYSLISLIGALLAMMSFFCERVYKGWWEMKRQPSDNRPIFTWLDAFSLLCAISQLGSTTVGYIYSRQHRENPFRVSLVSLFYIICMGASQLVGDHSKKRNE